MANKADNFAYRMLKIWEGKHPKTATENAVEVADMQGATRLAPVVSKDHWINEPGDEPGWLYEWPDGSRYIVGQNGHWIHSCRGAGRQSLRYETLEA
jgi:hypothetical protein